MEDVQRSDNDVSSDSKQHLISSRQRDAQNGPANNKPKQNGALTEKKATRKKKDMPLTLSQASTVPVTDNGFNNNVSGLTATSDTPNGTAKEMKNGNNVNKDTLQMLIKNNPQVVKARKKKKSNNVLNSSAKENVRADVTTNNAGDKASKQITPNGDCNDTATNKATVQTSTIAKHEGTDDERNKDKEGASTHQKHTYSTINYEFHEANHAIIDTFAIALDFFLRNDYKKCYCLVCDTALRIQNDTIRKHLCRHIRSKRHIQLLTSMIEDEERSINNGELFSKLALAREYMTSNDDSVKCLLCDNKDLSSMVKKNEQSLREHIASNAHRDAKGSWELPINTTLQQIHNQFQSRYNAKKYCCEFCNYQSPSELNFVKHLHVPYHVTRLMDIPDHTNKFKFYFCNACLIMWFGSVDTSDQHYELIEHKNRMMYGPDINDLSDKVVQFLTMSGLNAEVLLERSNRVKCYDEMRKRYVLHSFETDLRKYIPNIRAHPFGSRISDLGFPESDIDIFLDCNHMYEGKNSSYRQSQNLIATVVQCLSRNRDLWIVHDVILHSRTPIAKVRHIPSRLVCDISVTNGLAVENTKIIKCFNDAFPPCRKLILFLKQWMQLSGLLGSHLITSYALTWCVIFYLQTLLVLPSISDLIKSNNKSRLISGWEVGVSCDLRVNELNHTFEELLLGFFLFYGDFKYKKQVICPLLGRPIEKDTFMKLSDLPEEMAPYVAYMHTGTQEELPQALSISPLCVQDPFDLSHNLTKALNNKELKTFWNNCIASAKILKTTLPNLRSPLMPYSD